MIYFTYPPYLDARWYSVKTVAADDVESILRDTAVDPVVQRQDSWVSYTWDVAGALPLPKRGWCLADQAELICSSRRTVLVLNGDEGPTGLVVVSDVDTSTLYLASVLQREMRKRFRAELESIAFRLNDIALLQTLLDKPNFVFSGVEFSTSPCTISQTFEGPREYVHARVATLLGGWSPDNEVHALSIEAHGVETVLSEDDSIHLLSTDIGPVQLATVVAALANWGLVQGMAPDG